VEARGFEPWLFTLASGFLRIPCTGFWPHLGLF
jgi:hypothetical protein